MKVSSHSQRYLFTYSVILSSLSAISILRTLWGQGTKLELFDHLSLEGNIVNYEGKQQFALLRIFNLILAKLAWTIRVKLRLRPKKEPQFPTLSRPSSQVRAAFAEIFHLIWSPRKSQAQKEK